MQISNDLQKAILNNPTSIKSVEVYYPDEVQISGFTKSVTAIPFSVLLSLHEVVKGGDEYHRINFTEAEKIVLIFHNGETQVFN